VRGMISQNQMKKTILSIGTSALLLATAIPVYAETTRGVGTSAQINTGTVVGTTAARETVKANIEAKRSANLEKIVARGNTAIDARIDDLNKLNARVQELTKVSATEKAAIASEVESNIAGLNSLKSKIDADADVKTAASDEKTITGTFRIYALVVPRGHLYSAIDRIKTIGDLMMSLSTKIQARITAEQSAGQDVTALQASLVDFNAKIAAANAKAQTANTAIASLSPDKGDQVKLKSNTVALKSARTDVKSATENLKAARQDLKSILETLKSWKVNTSATSTTSVENTDK